MKHVILTAIAGQIFTQAKNADGSAKLDKNGNPFGFIRVENPETIDLTYAYGNAGVKRGNSALIAMSLEAWEKNGKFYKEGMEIKGNVVVLETTEFASAEEAKKQGYQPKMAGSGENAQPCLLDGKQIYRRTEFDGTCTKEDVLVRHNNKIEAAVKIAAKDEALNA